MAAFKAKHPNLSGKGYGASQQAYYDQLSSIPGYDTIGMDKIRDRAQSYTDNIKRDIGLDQHDTKVAATQQQFQKQDQQDRADWAKKHPGVSYPGLK